jgi:homoserine O-acetyltransferase
MSRIAVAASILSLAASAAEFPTPVESDLVVRDFKFTTGESIPELRMHYTTIGKAQKDAAGKTTNAVLIMHGTGGSGRGFLSQTFGGMLFGKGQLLDAEKYFIILTDDIGHGKSSKPSDGLHMKFPHYTYTDMVHGEYRVVTEALGVNHLRLVMGTSMGAMHTWMWGEMYPDFMEALMPLASAPVEIGGRNRMLRKMIMDSITRDPNWNNGEYKGPLTNMVAAQFALFMMTSSPLQLYKQSPTREQADTAFERRFYGRPVAADAPSTPATQGQARQTDANDMLYHYDCSRDYNPQPDLENIKAALYAINSADDQVNPPELGILEREIKRVKRGRYILIPTSDATRGHGTHSLPAIWGNYLAELLKESEPR